MDGFARDNPPTRTRTEGRPRALGFWGWSASHPQKPRVSAGYPRGVAPLDGPESRFWSGFAGDVLLNRTQEVAGSSPASSIAEACFLSGFAASAVVWIRIQELAPTSPKLLLSIPKSAVALCRVSPLPERTARYRHQRLELVVDGRTQEVAGSSRASAMKVEARFLYGFPAHGSFWLLGSSGSRSSPSVPKAPAAMSRPVEISSLRAGISPLASGHRPWPVAGRRSRERRSRRRRERA
jgi:hypothetical protein